MNCLALDFGASGGRLMLGKFENKKIEITEIHRFANEPVSLHNHLYWDFLRLIHEIKVGLKKAAALNIKIDSIGVDTWGVDYGLIDKNGYLISNPLHYRDSRTDGIYEKAEKYLSLNEIYKESGIQHMQLNTIYQLLAEQDSEIYKISDKILLMPDLFNYFLCGVMKNEYTEATTSQLVNPKTKKWNYELMDKFNINKDLFGEIVFPGTILGNLTEEFESECGLSDVKVIAVGGHDTASAVAATPLADENSAFLSSGTWSLLGKELDAPIVSDESMKYDFTNEGGVENKITFLKNITGLWIIQQLKKQWDTEISFPDIISAARAELKNSESEKFIIDVNAPEFTLPPNMPQAIREHCEAKGLGTPKNLGQHAIGVYRGLAKEYKRVLADLKNITKTEISTINIVGGGARDELLCEMTEEATGCKVVRGPIEAAVVGNILMQLKALGEIENLEEGRKIVLSSEL